MRLKEHNRVFTISFKPNSKEFKNLVKLREIADKRGNNYSYIVHKAIEHYLNELARNQNEG